MTAHSISILSELKIFGPLHQLLYQLHSVEGHAKCPTVPHVMNLGLVRMLLEKAASK